MIGADRDDDLTALHTDNLVSAQRLVAAAGDGDIDQHFKDRGHVWVPSERLGRCATCRK